MSRQGRCKLVKLILSDTLRGNGIHKPLPLVLDGGAEIEITFEQMVPHTAGRSQDDDASGPEVSLQSPPKKNQLIGGLAIPEVIARFSVAMTVSRHAPEESYEGGRFSCHAVSLP